MSESKKEMGYLEFPGVPYHVVCSLFMIGETQFEGQRYAQERGMVRLSSRAINIVANTLQSQSTDWIESNSAKYKEEPSKIKERVDNFYKQVIEIHNVRSSELLDWQPKKRIPGYELPKDKNAVLIKGWRLFGEDNIDTKTAEVIPVNWPTDWSSNSQQIPKEISKILGTSDATRIRTDRKTALKLSKGLNNLVWNFQEHPQTVLFSDRDPWLAMPHVGAIFGVVKET